MQGQQRQPQQRRSRGGGRQRRPCSSRALHHTSAPLLTSGRRPLPRKAETRRLPGAYGSHLSVHNQTSFAHELNYMYAAVYVPVEAIPCSRESQVQQARIGVNDE